ncbi:hypothetical protein CKY51_09225 [Xanthomonas maliensis]|nr:hypothetical protein CKY51_09225 [Xanthomonas maliensis]
MHAQRPREMGRACAISRSPCPARHNQHCDTRMTDYAAAKLTEMFVDVGRGAAGCQQAAATASCQRGLSGGRAPRVRARVDRTAAR